MPRNPWSVRTEDLRGGERFEILRDGSSVSFSDVFGLLETATISSFNAINSSRVTRVVVEFEVLTTVRSVRRW